MKLWGRLHIVPKDIRTGIYTVLPGVKLKCGSGCGTERNGCRTERNGWC
jgi:hypothetical protein